MSTVGEPVVIATFADRYGEERKIRRTQGRKLHVMNEANTPSRQMSKVASKLIGIRIRELRQAAGLTLLALIDRAGLTGGRQRMWEIENALRGQGAKLGTIYALAWALGCEVAEILPSVSDVTCPHVKTGEVLR